MEQYLSELINRITRVQNNLPIIIIDFFLENDAEVIDLNIDQLRRGITSDGELIEPEYASEVYAAFKQSIGSAAPLGTPDLILEGDFTGAFYLERRGNNLLFDSRDPKTADLDAKYEGIFKLTEENKNDFLSDKSSELINKIENEIFI